MSSEEGLFQFQLLNRLNIFCYCIVASLSILSVVLGDAYDFIIGVLSLMAIIASGLALAVPWLIFSVMGAQIMTFFFLGIVEVIKLIYYILFYWYKTKFVYVIFTGLQIFAYFLSSIVAITYVQKLIEKSDSYTRMVSLKNSNTFV